MGIRSTSSLLSDPLGLAAAQDREDRRANVRHRSVYRVCCIDTDSGYHLGLMRNLSAGGAKIEVELDQPVGSRVIYFWDSTCGVEAEIVWCDATCVGLRNIVQHRAGEEKYPPRGLRIPTELGASIWIDGNVCDAGIANISQSGVLACGLPELSRGKLVTVGIGPAIFQNAVVRWSAGGSAGIRFAAPLRLDTLRKILEIGSRTALSDQSSGQA